jgi:putative CocE/NonD family hydrolase
MTPSQLAAVAALACLLVPARSTGAADPAGIVLESNVPVRMRDGVTLRADVYRPAAEGRFPVLLQRTPYNKDGEASFAVTAAGRGYVVVVQDVRGRYTSEGEWYPFKHESNDGYDTVEWAAALPYADGRVGMFGGSYVGATQMLTAIARPPHLAGICPVVTASNYHSNWTYQGGAFEQWFNESWTSGLAHDTFIRQLRARTNATTSGAPLPLTAYALFNATADGRTPDATATLAPYFLDWLAHPSEDAYWKPWSIEAHFADIAVPMLTVAAWYDIFQDGSLRNYVGVKAQGGTDAARNGQHLIVTVGGHAGNGPRIGDVDFGAASKFDEDAATLSWYEYGPRSTSCIPPGRPTPSAATARSRPRRRPPNRPIATGTIRPIPCPRSVVRSVAMRSTSSRAPGISARSRRETTCSSTRRRRWRRTSK